MAITNLRQFNSNIQRFSKQLVPLAAIRFQKKIAFDALRLLVLITPVDKGQARANWQTSVGTFSRKEVENWQSVDASAEHFNALLSILPFQVIYLTNNVPYIEKLDGSAGVGPPSSKQAPNGILQPVINTLNSIFPN